MANLSIFAKGAFVSSRGYIKRVSSLIRADQIATATKAKLNPESDFDQDICIYIKPELDETGDFKFSGKSAYLDVVDGWAYLPVLKKHPKLSAIVCSERDFVSLASENLANKIILIPQHHCNFKNEVRTRQEITTVGVIGNYRAFPYLPASLKPELAKRGMQLIEFSQFFTRQDIIDFYKQIDVQIVWRPYKKQLGNPLKIVNAASFGIPTIALDEIYFKEMGNCYIGVNRLDQFLHELDLLRTFPDRYATFAKLCVARAENYHIKKIAKLYKDLK